jgi:hypothetical protein
MIRSETRSLAAIGLTASVQKFRVGIPDRSTRESRHRALNEEEPKLIS